MDLIRAGFHGDGGEPTPKTAVLGVEGVGYNGILGHGLDYRAILQDGAAPCTKLAGWRAVNKDLRGALKR